MKEIKCPGCSALMKKEEMPDLTIDECPKCGGIFLDKDELNILSTGMAGDIEINSTAGINLDDIYPDRSCPVCKDKKMKKVNLLEYTDLIFDYCPDCQGFYLDKNELDTMNQKLKEIHESGSSQEFRDYIGDYLVRIDVPEAAQLLNPVSIGLTSSPVPQKYIKISVFFNKPLNIGFNLHNEKWTAKLAKAFKVFKGQDIEVGNKDFDSKFIIESSSESKIKAVLTPDVQEAILDFVKSKPSIFSKKGKFWAFDTKVVYLEGPYMDSPLMTKDDINATEDIVNGTITKSLLKIAEMVDGNQG